MAELRAASVDNVCCFLGAVTFCAVDLSGLELGRAVRCWRKGDFSGIGGGGVEGGGEEGPSSVGGLKSIGGLGSGGGFGLLAFALDVGIMGKAPGIGCGAWYGGGVAGLVLALRNELPPNDSGVKARGKESIDDDSGGLRKSSPDGLAGRLGGTFLDLRSVGDGGNGSTALPSSWTESTTLSASLPVALKLGGPGGAGGSGNNFVGKLVPLPPSPTDLPFRLSFFLNFHASLSVSRISSTSFLLLEKRPAFFLSSFGLVESDRCISLALPMLSPPVLLARLACNCARRA